MNESETKTEPAQDFAVEDLQDEVQGLRTLMSVSLIVIIVFSFCVNWYLFKQDRIVQGRIDQDRQTAGALQTGIVAFWNDLNEYGKAHPDFAPVLEKYRALFATNAPAPAAKPR